MSVRVCTQDDVDFLLSLTTEFNDTLYHIPLSPEKSRAHLSNLVQHGICFRTDRGAIVGAVADDPFRDWVALVELGWFCTTPADGVRLLQAFERTAEELEVNEVRMTTLETNKSVGGLLKRRGYFPVETSHRLLT